MSFDWRIRHGKVILEFITFLNARTENYILKGDTALYLCYNLDRFSEDIDLDGRAKELTQWVEKFCLENGYSFHIAKSTDTVERCMLNYGNIERPLKIEASYRRKEISADETDKINGIQVYRIEQLCIMKIYAYTNRDKIRDLYDVTFIFSNYHDCLSSQTLALLRGAVEYKGVEQFDYVIQNQQDELIDSNKLSEDFLNMYDGLGLLYEQNEKLLLKNGLNEDEEELQGPILDMK